MHCSYIEGGLGLPLALVEEFRAVTPTLASPLLFGEGLLVLALKQVDSVHGPRPEAGKSPVTFRMLVP